MLGQVISLVLDIGIGLLAYRQATRANRREDKSELRLDHLDARVARLENK